MFGELIGVWLLGAWRAIGRPRPVTLAEIGPGRGTLMKDMVRTLGQARAGILRAAATFALIETSPRLDRVQKATLGELAARSAGTRPSPLPEQPLLIVGNEFFDALPIRQYVKIAGRWRERAIGLDEAGELRFRGGAGTPDPALLPPMPQRRRTARSSRSAPARRR